MRRLQTGQRWAANPHPNNYQQSLATCFLVYAEKQRLKQQNGTSTNGWQNNMQHE